MLDPRATFLNYSLPGWSILFLLFRNPEWATLSKIGNYYYFSLEPFPRPIDAATLLNLVSLLPLKLWMVAM